MEQKINALLQKAVLTLCKQNYQSKIEVDGIICISSMHNTVEKHVVKIHQQLDAGVMTVDENISWKLNQNAQNRSVYDYQGRGDAEYNMSFMTDQTEEVWPGKSKTSDSQHGGKVSSASQPRSRMKKRSRRSLVGENGGDDDKTADPDFTCSITNSTADNFPTIVNELKSGRSLRKRNQNALLNMYADSPVAESDESGSYSNASDMGGIRSEADRYGLSESSMGYNSSKGFGSASVLLKLLAKPQRNRERQEEFRMMKKEPQIEIVNDELLASEGGHLHSAQSSGIAMNKGSESVVENNSDYMVERQSESDANFGTGDVPDTTSGRQEDNMSKNRRESSKAKDIGEGFTVKEEPVWNEEEYGNSGSQAANSMSHSEKVGIGEQSATSDSNQSNCREEGEETEKGQNLSSKRSKGTTGEEEKEQDKDMAESNSRRSILMNILKGKSLKEAYIGEEGGKQGQQQGGGSEQENSLLYRLPFVSFQDLFPGNSSTMLQNEAALKQSGGSSRPRHTLQTIDYMASQMMQRQTPSPAANTGQQKSNKTARRGRTDGTYSTRLSSGRKKHVSYAEMAGFVLSSEEDDDDGVLKDPYDSPYTPEHAEYETVRQEQEVVATGAKRRKMGPKCKTIDRQRDKGAQKSEEKSASHANMGGNWLNGFPCNICGRFFTSKFARDQHEDEERETQFYKCPLCSGFFGSEETKLAHLKERHGVIRTEQDKFELQLQASHMPVQVAFSGEPGSLGGGEPDDNRESENDTETSAPVMVKEEQIVVSDINCNLCDMTFENEILKKVHLKSFHGYED